MKIPNIDSYLLNGAAKPISEFFTKIAESDPKFKHENPEYYKKKQEELEKLHQPFSPQQYKDIYQLKFPALTERVLDFKDRLAKDCDRSFSNIIDGFKELNLLVHRYKQLKAKNEETNFGLLGVDSSFATSRKLDDFFTESFSQIQSTLIKALPDSGKYSTILLKNLALENQQYPQKSKKWQQEFLSAAKLISIGERLVKDYKNPNNTDDERTIRFQSLVLFSERLDLFSHKNSLIEYLVGSESPLLGVFANQHKQLNDFWDKQLTPVFDKHMRYLTDQDNSVLMKTANLKEL